MLKSRIQVSSDEQAQKKVLRLWPGMVIVSLQWLVWLIIPIFINDDMAITIGVFGGMLGGLLIMIWWVFFSRAPRIERWSAAILMIVALVVMWRISHESIETGLMGMMYFVYTIPVLSLAFVGWAVASRHLPDRPRRVWMVATILVACGLYTLFRSEGITSDASADFTWRWSKTHEERLLAQDVEEFTSPPSASVVMRTEVDWPGFRGPERDGIISNLRIETDWSGTPPVELWRRSIGPGCSSFAVWGDLLYTQEQRGDNEVVSCYNRINGKPVWRHRDAARFWDSHVGAGPRATPTLNNGRIYTLGATGILNVLDAWDGSVVWSRNAASDTEAKDSGWGIASSPLVVDDVVVVAATGKLVAYDLATGNPRWFGPDGGDSYSSPHLLTIDSVKQILLMSGSGATSIAPADGKLLWEYPWPRETRIVQPALTDDGDVLISAGGRKGMRRLAVGLGPEGWKIEERWTSSRLRPDFNDFVVHKGHVYGIEGLSLSCIDIKDGKRKWKEGQYGGQIVLLADQDLLLILSEKGELVLVGATPDNFRELARFPAIEGKTWNHPVLVGDILLVRNGLEMAAFRLFLEQGEG
jgi:hypothetical protein